MNNEKYLMASSVWGGREEDYGGQRFRKKLPPLDAPPSVKDSEDFPGKMVASFAEFIDLHRDIYLPYAGAFRRSRVIRESLFLRCLNHFLSSQQEESNAQLLDTALALPGRASELQRAFETALLQVRKTVNQSSHFLEIPDRITTLDFHEGKRVVFDRRPDGTRGRYTPLLSQPI